MGDDLTMQHYDRNTITEEQKIKAVMNPGEWADLYAITARLGYHPQSRYFGAVTKVLNQMVSNGEIETKRGNLPTPFYRLIMPVSALPDECRTCGCNCSKTERAICLAEMNGE